MKIFSTAVAGALIVSAGCESGDGEPQPDKPATTSQTTAKPTATTPPAATPPPAPTPAVSAKGPFPESTNPALKDPEKSKEKAPATFKVKFETTAGDFTMECTRDWAPHGVDRFYNLIKIGFYDDVAFFRAVQQPKPFMVQFGIHGNPDVSKVWRDANLPEDKPKESNTRGMVSYAMAGSPTTRSTQLFINFGDNSRLDKMGFAPICKVGEEDMKVVDKIESSYGETPSRDQADIQSQGNKLLRQKYPKLDYIKTARLVEPAKTKK
jgi:peptidyl-prolyl cis-trans isomerase A (cyclophilin A)